METNQRLEELSEQVRMGNTVSFNEALEVIAYQEKLKKERKEEPKGLGRFLKRLLTFKRK